MSQRRQTELEPAWVLHHRPYRDSSEIVDLLTQAQGRVAVVARGSRRPGRNRQALEPFRPLLVSWRGRGELQTLVSVEPRGAAVRATGQRLLSMFYLNELLLRLLQKHDPHPQTFADYEWALTELGAGGPEAPVLRVFEKRLLDAMGYGLNLEADEQGCVLEPGVSYRYLPEQGPVRALDGDTGGLLVQGASLIALAAERLEDEVELREARLVLRRTLDLYLGDRPLKSREVLRAMRNGASGGRFLAE
ncbi:MAG: DNA repair protein RecO [Gammaproteobacteria bacterium]